MTRRMLDSAIWTNEKFGVMPPMARLLAIGIINQADDQGRGKAHPVYLRSQVFPYDDVMAVQVSEWLAMVATNETILLYQVDGKDYYQILNWWSYQSHQYAMPSQYPKPDGWKDRIRKTLTKGVIVTCNWITTDGKPSPDTCDEQGAAIQVNIQVINQVNEQVKVQDTVTVTVTDYVTDKDYIEGAESESSVNGSSGGNGHGTVDPSLFLTVIGFKDPEPFLKTVDATCLAMWAYHYATLTEPERKSVKSWPALINSKVRAGEQPRWKNGELKTAFYRAWTQ